jgi:hypothetical protein
VVRSRYNPTAVVTFTLPSHKLQPSKVSEPKQLG